MTNPYEAPQEPESATSRPNKTKYLTAPVASPNMPGGIPFIVGNEAAERFSFYGMRCILVVFMTRHLLGANGEAAPMSEVDATAAFHWFAMSAYFFPILGAILADVWWGKYRTILILSAVYCLGHLALALDETRLGLFAGLAMIAVGAGGIKPCVSAHVGDQFGTTNQHLINTVFGWFYFSINLGAFASTVLTPELLARYGPHWAFGVPGLLMFIATVVFWLGRNRFVHVPPGGVAFLREAFSSEGLRAAGKLTVIYAFVAVFFSLFEQTGSTWVFQAQQMDRVLSLSWLQGINPLFRAIGLGGIPSTYQLEAAQIQAANPALILIFIPLFAKVVYPAINRVFPLTPLRKIALGMAVMTIGFAVPSWVQMRIESGDAPYIGWQLLAYMILTSAEVMVSITALEFSYTQAPKTMKSFIMSLYLLAIAAGNLIAAAVNELLSVPAIGSRLEGANYFWFFTGLMAITAVAFVPVATMYREKTYLQDEGTGH